jgi:hypothetical protein
MCIIFINKIYVVVDVPVLTERYLGLDAAGLYGCFEYVAWVYLYFLVYLRTSLM